MLLSFLCINTMFAQSNNGTNVTGDDVGWGDGYDLIYKVDGTVYKTITLEEGATITPEPTPTKEGYTFNGWSDIPATMPAHNVEVTGSFSINSYIITYKVDGEVYKRDTLVYASAITAFPSPTKEGYTFSGWSEIPTTMPANDVEVTGSYTINSYKLVYKVDGLEYKSLTLEYGSTIMPESELTKEGYTFNGWSEIPATMPANDMEVTGSFSINSYILTYKVDGEVYKRDTLVYASAITAFPSPTKEGYTFSGWSEIPTTMPANDVEIVGTFSINSYKLVYMIDGAEYNSLTLEYNSTVTPEAEPTKEGYTFSGWSEIPATMPASNVEVIGTFSINSYKLVYKVDGAEYNSLTLEYNSTVTPEAEPTKEGYTFSGWSEIPSNMPANDVEVTGSYTVNTYALKYMVDGVLYHTDSIAFGTAITLIDEPSREGETFSGWVNAPETMPAHDVVISGTFGINSYSINYYVDGTLYHTMLNPFGTEIAPLDEPTKEGYTFSGWSEIPATMPANDVEIVGSFSINSYKLVYMVDGSEYKSLTLEYGSTITPETEPTKEGYTFSGWSEIPSTMPASDVEVTGTFAVNKYLLTVLVDEVVIHSDSIAYGTRLIDYLDLIIQNGIDLTYWEWYSQIETITMPAHDVIINAVLDAVSPLLIDGDNSAIFDLTGRKIHVDDITTLPAGIYIRNGIKFMVR